MTPSAPRSITAAMADRGRSCFPSLRARLWLLLGAALLAATAFAQGELPDDTARIHYQRTDSSYQGWVLHVWEDTLEEVTWGAGLPVTGTDDYGAYWDVRLADDAARLGFIVHMGDTKDPGPDMFLEVSRHGREIWLVSGSDTIHTAPPLAPPGAGVARVHYLNPAGDLDGWVLHVWEDTIEQVTWEEGLPPTGAVPGGLYWDVRLSGDPQRLGFIVHRGDEKDPGPDIFVDLAELGNEVWLVSGSATVYTTRPDLARVGGGDLRAARAHWVSRDLLLWDTGVPLPEETYALHVAPDAGLELADGTLVGGETFALTVDEAGVPAEVVATFPHLAGLTALRLPAEALDMVPGMLRAQVALSRSSAGAVVDATGVQVPGVIDDLYAAAALTAPLGVTWTGAVPSIGVWAPTARRVSLQRFGDPSSPAIETLPMERDAAAGVWSITGSPEWRGQYYLFEVEVYAPSTGQVVTNLVTDPYSVSLSLDSTRSQVVDLNDPALAPPGWDALVKPAVADPVDIVVYELHVRDFSAADPTVPADLVGTYRAFTLPDTNGVNHLRSLAEAGLTHLHLLPTFDIATIAEDRSTWREPTIDVVLPTTGPGPQEAVAAVRDRDGFNWGYDPYHYDVPEGSYATDPNGTARIVEYREMVMALWDLGLRVVVDVVYNHTNASGQGQRSVLDRIVPGYYHRLDEAGNVATSTCCANTATEHAMMERLMVDSVRLWAEQYKVDAFRFDLMGHHLAENMAAVRAGLDALTVEANGVDGAGIYVYGEGWDFGEVASNARGVNATQTNMAGTGIGTFNDRLRDAVRGGGPFDGAGAIVGNQGFASGRYVLPNATTAGYDRESERVGMLHAADQVRVGLAGNLAAFTFIDAGGNLVSGADVDYNGQSAGYGAVPQDHIVYVSKHDNQTLWDILAYKLPSDLPTADRVRLQNLALSTVAFAQGVPFFHAGSDLLRSKSLDRNSYDAGDWFNAIDWTGGATAADGSTGRGNGFGRGLPLAGDNQELWSLMRPMLANPLLQPTPEDVAFAAAVFREWLSIRRAEPLLRLRTAQDIEERVSFFNTGPDQVPGVIVMLLRDGGGTGADGLADLDPDSDGLLIVFNASPRRVSLAIEQLSGTTWLLHPVQAQGVDAATLSGAYVTGANGRVSVPGLSTVVFTAPVAP